MGVLMGSLDVCLPLYIWNGHFRNLLKHSGLDVCTDVGKTAYNVWHLAIHPYTRPHTSLFPPAGPAITQQKNRPW